ncbi:tRNA lysidine(34) synthetase TilS [Sphingorhabdus pulchriflava]|uniref:tRNA(Ile)-lysidine synthase n=1 Tax=Sphingorhabdus pulchriflava TaxID=2292257 RepID=A0A371B6D8_9SPHN|nr:tRNA lysidine(34) synthetase TilS [Sphingorhabdus pulchriflava]RDV03013.1 tRNA lysidine(34) synthetase TilS [Sphingorhabdus pulchriflava]
MVESSANILAEFSASMRRLTAINPATLEAPHIGLAVSGGPDSLALLLLAHQAFPKAIHAATVDHELRPEANDEAHYVAGLCAERGIPHAILKPERPITGNLQSAARDARYGLLHKWAASHGLNWIATAHHADDQLETLLMRIARGSGIAGLSSIRETNGRIIRPLLGFTKAQLVAVCQEQGVIPCEDPSNANVDFDRVQIRNWLKTAPPLLNAARVSRTVDAVREAHEALEWMAARLQPERIAVSENPGTTLDPAGLPPELVRRLLIRALQSQDAHIAPRGETIDRALETLAAGGKLSVGNLLCTGGTLWHIEPAPLRGENR